MSRPTGRPRGQPRKIPSVLQSDPGQLHMRYLDRLIAAAPAGERKRADWLKFCRVCGADISHLPRGVRTCGEDCAGISVATPAEFRRQGKNEAKTRYRWRQRIGDVNARWSKE